MVDRPILFSAAMVQALLAGTKTQTRRVIPQPEMTAHGWHIPWQVGGGVVTVDHSTGAQIAAELLDGVRIQPGDRLWVREAWRAPINFDRVPPRDIPSTAVVVYEAGGDGLALSGRLRASIHMPRWASRLTLIVNDVRVQRLQEISRDDAMAEGIVQTWGDFMGDPPEWAVASINRHGDASGSHIYDNRTSAENYRELWNHINGTDAWAANPWVVAYSFEVHQQNIDALPAGDRR